MKKYQFLVERFEKFSKYLRRLALVSLMIFIVVTAFNINNQSLSLVSYIFMMITLVCAVESLALYILSKVLKNK